MKKMFLISTIVSSLIGTITAQTANSTAQPQPQMASSVAVKSASVRAKEKVSEINKMTPLQQTQFTQLNNLFTDYYTKQDAIRANVKTLSAKDYEKQANDLRTQHDAAFKAILTPEQLKTVQAKQDGPTKH